MWIEDTNPSPIPTATPLKFRNKEVILMYVTILIRAMNEVIQYKQEGALFY